MSMFDCNLIKSRAQKLQEGLLPAFEPVYQKMQMPMSPLPAVPMTPYGPIPPTRPASPQFPSSPSLPPAPPESEEAFPVNPLLPKILPTSSTLTVPANPLLPSQYATTLDYESLQYLNGYLRTQIGKYVEAEFLVGSTNISTMFGRLAGVGLNYILIEDIATGDVSACDFYNIKFFRSHAHSMNMNG